MVLAKDYEVAKETANIFFKPIYNVARGLIDPTLFLPTAIRRFFSMESIVYGTTALSAGALILGAVFNEIPEHYPSISNTIGLSILATNALSGLYESNRIARNRVRQRQLNQPDGLETKL